MRRFFRVIVCLAAAVFVAVSAAGCGSAHTQSTEYFRIHIRANSNSETDQAVKYTVRDRVVEYLTPILKDVETYALAAAAVGDAISGIEATADETLDEHCFSYRARAQIREEDFPTRKYGDLVLPAGRYRALIVELGSGEGDNWWCVAYPPLCFGGKEEIRIKSKIVEFFESLFENPKDRIYSV